MPLGDAGLIEATRAKYTAAMNAVEEKHAAATKAKEYEFAGTLAAKDAELASAMQWTQGATEKLEQATAVVEELQNSMMAVRANAKHTRKRPWWLQ
jgi:uncharacterized protein YbjT (DUF2867 family)